KSTMLQMWQAEDAAFRRAMPDFRQEDVEVWVEDDRIHLTRTLRGTKPDGTQLRVPIRNAFTVAEGKIVGLQAHVPPEDRDALRALVLSGGQPHPDFAPESDPGGHRSSALDA